MIFIKKLTEKNLMILAIIWIIAFFIILIICYSNKEVAEEKMVVSSNIKEIELSNELNIGLFDENLIETINPIEYNSTSVSILSDLIYNGLFEYNDKMTLAPVLISEYAEIGAKSYAFKLKENIYFHNGQVLTSKNVKNTIERIYLNTDSIYNKYVENIQSVKIIDNNMFRINLIEEEKNFEQNLIFPILNDEANCGTNNYKIKEIKENKMITIENLSNEEKILNIYVYNDLKNLYRDFKNKKLDIINSVDGFNYKKSIGEFGYKEKLYKGDKYIYLDFNTGDGKVFRNTKLQNAIMNSINKKEIISKIYNNNAFEIENFEYNLDKSVEVLESQHYTYLDNGWYNKDELFKIVILLNEKELTKLKIAYIIKEQLEKIGINVEINSVNETEYFSKIKNLEYDILISSLNYEIKCDKEKYKFILCNKLSLLYSYSVVGEINPNSRSIFYNVDTWKKIL